MPGEETIVNRLGDIPILNDTWTRAWNCYAHIKDLNSLTKLTLETAECSVKTAVKLSAPIVSRCQPQIESMDSFACEKLNDFEMKYPVIKLPSEEVYSAALDVVEPVVSRVKPVVSGVQGVVEESKRQINHMKDRGHQFVAGARDVGLDTVTGVVTRTLDTPPGRLAARTADGALDFADGLMDKYMPELEYLPNDCADGNDLPQGEDTNDDDEEEVVGSELELEQMHQMNPTPERVVVHLKSVSKKLRQRLFQRAMRDYKGAQTRTQEALGKLHGVVDLMDYAKDNIDAAKCKTEDMWQKITSEEDNGDMNRKEEKNLAMTCEERIIHLGRLLAHQVRSGVASIEKYSPSVGQFARNPISKSQEYKEVLVQFATLDSIQNLSSSSLEGLRTSLRTLQDNIQLFMDNFETPEWMMVSSGIDINMDDLCIKEADISITAQD